MSFRANDIISKKAMISPCFSTNKGVNQVARPAMSRTRNGQRTITLPITEEHYAEIIKKSEWSVAK